MIRCEKDFSEMGKLLLREADISLREANQADIPKIQALLRQTQLSTDDILADGTHYWLAEDADGHPLGVVGLE